MRESFMRPISHREYQRLGVHCVSRLIKDLLEIDIKLGLQSILRAIPRFRISVPAPLQ